MSTEEIRIRVDPEAARVYREADASQRAQFEALFSMQLKDVQERRAAARRLLKVLDEMQGQAEARGLTPEILQSILAGD